MKRVSILFVVISAAFVAALRQPVCDCTCCVQRTGQCLPANTGTIEVDDCKTCNNDYCAEQFALCRSSEAAVSSTCVDPNSVFDVILICGVMFGAFILFILSVLQYKVPFIQRFFAGSEAEKNAAAAAQTKRNLRAETLQTSVPEGEIESNREDGYSPLPTIEEESTNSLENPMSQFAS